MNNLWFQKITIAQIQYINVQPIVIVTFEFTGAARGFRIMSCAAKKLDSTALLDEYNAWRRMTISDTTEVNTDQGLF